MDVQNSASSKPAGGIVVLILAPVAVILVSAVVAWGVWTYTHRPGTFWTGSVVAALTVTAVGALIGAGALAMTWFRWPEFLPQGVLAAMGLRMFITFGGIVVFTLIVGKPELQFFLGIVGFYIVGLISETVVAIKITTRKRGTPS